MKTLGILGHARLTQCAIVDPLPCPQVARLLPPGAKLVAVDPSDVPAEVAAPVLEHAGGHTLALVPSLLRRLSSTNCLWVAVWHTLAQPSTVSRLPSQYPGERSGYSWATLPAALQACRVGWS